MEILLLISLILPALAAVVIWLGLIPPREAALSTAVAVLVITGILAIGYQEGSDPSGIVPGQYAVVEDLGWFGQATPWLDIRLSVGLDGLSLWLYVLTALLTAVAVLVSLGRCQVGVRGILRAFDAAGDRNAGVFAACDLILFYIFFELTLGAAVFPDWHLGKRSPTICSYQIFPFHFSRKCFNPCVAAGYQLVAFFTDGKAYLLDSDTDGKSDPPADGLHNAAFAVSGAFCRFRD